MFSKLSKKAECICIIIAFTIPAAGLFVLADPVAATGTIEIRNELLGGKDVHSFGVLPKSRQIIFTTNLLPAVIMERDGHIVRKDTLLMRGIALHTYVQASQTEEALWRNFFR